MQQKNPYGRIGKWILQLQEFEIEIKHRSGKQNANAYFLSRNVCVVDVVVPEPVAENVWAQKQAEDNVWDRFIII